MASVETKGSVHAAKNPWVFEAIDGGTLRHNDPVAILHLYCQPGARQTQWAGWHDGRPKLQLKAPPVDGAANQALIEFVAQWLSVPKSRVRLQAGQQSRFKRLAIDGVDEAELERRLPDD
jgi:uncharacterized protein (TIGR00251 family)